MAERDPLREARKYAERARLMGASDAVVIKASDVAVDPRTILKCQFGCDQWGRNWTCPSAPGALRPWEFERVLARYSTALLIHCAKKELSQEVSFQIESDAFVDGCHFAFSMSDCGLCSRCAHPEPCRNPRKARPSMQSLGIDVYATARRQGLPIKTMRDREEAQNWYSLVLLE